MNWKYAYIFTVSLLLIMLFISVYITTIVVLQNKDGFCPPCPQSTSSNKDDILFTPEDVTWPKVDKYAIYPNTDITKDTPIKANYPGFIYEYEKDEDTKCTITSAYYIHCDGDILSDDGTINYNYRELCANSTEVWECKNGSKIVIDH